MKKIFLLLGILILIAGCSDIQKPIGDVLENNCEQQCKLLNDGAITEKDLGGGCVCPTPIATLVNQSLGK